MEPADSPSPSPDWLTLPENLTVEVFDFINSGQLLSLRRVCTRWQRLAEASAQTRDALLLMQCGCEDNDTCYCSINLMDRIIPDQFFIHHDLNPDGTAYTKLEEDSQIILNDEVNAIHCRSFDWKNAQLLGRLFPQISQFTVAHIFISARHIDQIIYLLAQWSPTLTTFKFNSDYTLENPDKRVTRAQAVGTANQPTEAYLNTQLTRLFRRLKSLPELKNLTLHYAKGKINSTAGDFAFLPRLEELLLDRTSLEAGLQAACQRYLAPAPVPGTAPQPVLCRFAHYAEHYDSTASEFTRFLQYSPEALPLATASTWNSQFSFQPLIISEMPNFLGRFPSLGCLLLPITPGCNLAPLSRSLSSQNIPVLVLEIVDTDAVVEDAAEDAGNLVPVPSVRGITITLVSPDHGQIYPLLAQIPTVFPRLESLFLLDCRSECFNAPPGPPFSVTADEPREFAHFAAELQAAYPNATQPAKCRVSSPLRDIYETHFPT